MLSAVVIAIGHRAWGNGPISGLGGRFWGTLLAGLGFIIGGAPWWAWLPLAAAFYWARKVSPRPFFHTFQKNEWPAAFKRTLHYVPLVLVITTYRPEALLYAPAILLAMPGVYYCAYLIFKRFGKPEPVSLAELGSGFMIGTL